MKSGLVWNWKSLLILAGIPFVAASLQGPLSYAEDEDTKGDTNAVATNLVLVSEDTNTPFTNAALVAELPAPGTNTAKPSAPTMPDLKFNEGTVGLVKLAQSGVTEDVMKAYITNVNSRFSLTSDQIIYLNDLGVNPTVITAMIEHDGVFDAEVQRILAQNQQPATQYPIVDSATYTMEQPVSAPAIDYTGYTETAPVNYAPEDANYFYDSLAPYGSWVYVAGYGLCWQPTVSVRNHDWRPYCDRGRWLYTDCGWYWQSDYSWGWAPFHYGRWYCDTGRGWVWCPNRVWGPAWVSWRQSSGYCGWAPLPPWAHYGLSVGFTFGNHGVGSGFEFGLSYGYYNFVPVEHLCDYSPSRYCLAPGQGARVYQQTTVVNDVSVQNRRVFNRGIDPGRVETASRTPVRRAVVQEAPLDGRGRNQTDRLERRGDSLVVLSPQLPTRGQRGTDARTASTRGATQTGNSTGGESVLLPSPRNSSTGGRVGYSDRTQPNANRGAAASATPAAPAASENRSRGQVYTRPDSTGRGNAVNSASGANGEVYPPNSLILSGRWNGPNPPAATRDSSQQLYLPNRTTIEQTTPSTGRGNAVVPRDGTFQTSGPAMVPPSSRESTAFSLRLPQPTVVTAQPGPAAPTVNRGGYNTGTPPAQNNSAPQWYNNNAATPATVPMPSAPTQPNDYQGRGSFGSSLNRTPAGIPSREPVTRIAPAQPQADAMTPSRSTGGGSYSRGNYSAPANNYSAPLIPQRSQPAPGPVYTPRSEPVMRQQQSAPPPAAAPAPAPATRSAPDPAPSVPSRSSSPAPSSDSGRSAPAPASRGGR